MSFIGTAFFASKLLSTRASFSNFCNFFYSFQQLPKYSRYISFNVLSCFQEFYIAIFCNFFDFCMQLFATFLIFACNFCNFFDFCMLLFATFSIFACKIGCFKSFTVKCAHKCNLQRINATFAENKCNFLALLLQQKLALLIVLLLGRWDIRKRMSEGLMLEKSLVRLELFFSIRLANFSPVDEKYLLNVLAISKAVVSDDRSSFCTLLKAFVCF